MTDRRNDGIRSLVSCFIGAALILALRVPSGAETKVLWGKHWITYDIVNPLGVEFLPDYANESYSQKVLQEDEFSKRLRIEINLRPLETPVPFPFPQPLPAEMKAFLRAEKDIPAGDRSISRQTAMLVGESRTFQEAVSAIFNWIVDRHTYDAGKDTPQDGGSVFSSGRGSCVGFTNLAIAMLRSAGIPARYAHGYLPPGYEWGISKKYWGVQITGGGYHGWIEVYGPGVGWIFSDLLHSKHFVDPFHILRYIDGINLNPRHDREGTLDVEEATTYTIFQEENTTLPIDQIPFPQKDILARKDGSLQSGTIYGTIRDAAGRPVSKGALLVPDGTGTRTVSFERGVYSLFGLKTGDHRVVIQAEGMGRMEKILSARQGELMNLDIVFAPQASSPVVPPAVPPKKSPRKTRMK